MPSKPSVRIDYCPACGWLLRAAWLAEELLSTFGEDLEQVSLAPAERGTFRITLEGDTLWDRRVDGGFPQAAELKRRVRDRAAPGRRLGHLEPSEP